MQATQVIVKLTANAVGFRRSCGPSRQTVHKFLLPAESSFETLDALVKKTVPAVADGNGQVYSLVHIDSDGDQVQLRSNADLKAALASLQVDEKTPDERNSVNILRLRLEHTQHPTAVGSTRVASAPCCVMQGVFAIMVFSCVIRGCCPCLFALAFLFAISNLVGFSCRSYRNHCCRQKSTHMPSPHPWVPVFFTTGTRGSENTVGRNGQAHQLAQAWSIGRTEALHVLERAQIDASIHALVSEALKKHQQPPPVGNTGTTSHDQPSAVVAVPLECQDDSSSVFSADGVHAKTPTAAQTAITTAAAVCSGSTENAVVCGLNTSDNAARTSPQTEGASVQHQPIKVDETHNPKTAGAPRLIDVEPSPSGTEETGNLNFHEKLKVLTATMGFEEDRALAALESTGGDVRRAIQELILLR